MSESTTTDTTEVRFYHLQKQTLDQALPLILEKAVKTEKNVVVRLIDAKEATRINAHLWSYKVDSFMPHGCKKEGNAEKQPIWLTDQDENPNNANILILTGGMQSERMTDYDLCCEMLDGRSNEQVTSARARWKTYKEKGYTITYWMQSDAGGWEQKA
jgi:DNA polymerase-3 subunit chi